MRMPVDVACVPDPGNETLIENINDYLTKSKINNININLRARTNVVVLRYDGPFYCPACGVEIISESRINPCEHTVFVASNESGFLYVKSDYLNKYSKILKVIKPNKDPKRYIDIDIATTLMGSNSVTFMVLPKVPLEFIILYLGIKF